MRYKILDEAKVNHLGEERSAVDHVLQPADSGKVGGQVGLVKESNLTLQHLHHILDP